MSGVFSGDSALARLYPGAASREEQEAPARSVPALEFDLDLRRCGVCRRELLPWQQRCPDDDGPALFPHQLRARDDALRPGVGYRLLPESAYALEPPDPG